MTKGLDLSNLALSGREGGEEEGAVKGSNNNSSASIGGLATSGSNKSSPKVGSKMPGANAIEVLSLTPRDIISLDAMSNAESETESNMASENQPMSPIITKAKKTFMQATLVHGGDFEPERHFYPRVLNATIHPLVASFLMLGNTRIIHRYCHLNPLVNEEFLASLLNYKPRYFNWAGCDLFNVTTCSGQRQMIVVETNSCPSGQKSMPVISDTDDYGGYRIVIEKTFKRMLEKADKAMGGLAVICDKNMMEASGYAAVIADVMQEQVHLVEFFNTDPDPPVRWRSGVMNVRDAEGNWFPIRACFRYVTQKPWNRFPIHTKTIVLNNIVACLAGGRNKMMADRAYDFFNHELEDTGLNIRVPETIRNVSKSEIPLWIDSMGGHAVLKVPYSNAGQGVYTITNERELKEFMDKDHHYDKFIVQSLVGNASWSSTSKNGKFYHVGTIPNKKVHTYVSDLRMMVAATEDGFQPVAIYARKARKPLVRHLEEHPDTTSWEMLGTNLSVKVADGWSTESQRLLLMDRKDFNCLGIGVDDLIDAYVQTVLSVIAIDKMCHRLMPNDSFDMDLFSALNPDPALLEEILF